MFRKISNPRKGTVFKVCGGYILGVPVKVEEVNSARAGWWQVPPQADHCIRIHRYARKYGSTRTALGGGYIKYVKIFANQC